LRTRVTRQEAAEYNQEARLVWLGDGPYPVPVIEVAGAQVAVFLTAEGLLVVSVDLDPAVPAIADIEYPDVVYTEVRVQGDVVFRTEDEH
jgi:hypothetical protein